MSAASGSGADDVLNAIAEAVLFPTKMLTFIADQAIQAPCNDRWRQHHQLLHQAIASPAHADAPSDEQIGVALVQIEASGEVELSSVADRLKRYPDFLRQFRQFSTLLLEEYMLTDDGELPRAVFRTMILQSLLSRVESNFQGAFTAAKFMSDMKVMIGPFYAWLYGERNITSDKAKAEAARFILLRAFVLVAQAVVTIHSYVEGAMGFFPRYTARVLCGFAAFYHKLHVPFHRIHAECLASLGNLLKLCRTLEERKDVARRLSLHKLFRGTIETADLRPTFSFDGGRTMLVQTLVASSAKIRPSTLNVILALQPMHCWFDQFPELLDGLWLPMVSIVRGGVRGSGRRKPGPPPVHSHFQAYKVFQHHIAVDRAILRYWFKCSKGRLGMLNHDVISDVERYIYGQHSWPRWFFRDRYTPTARRQ